MWGLNIRIARNSPTYPASGLGLLAAALLGVRQRVPCNSLEDRYRGLLRLDHGSMRKDEGLFQRVLPFQHGVAHEVREYHPRGIWREFPALFWTVSLKLGILFHRI